MGESKITGRLYNLERFAKALKQASTMRVNVGILGGKSSRSDGGETNAEIGSKMEFGFTIADGPFAGAKVPARSFLRMPLKFGRGLLWSELKKESVLPLLMDLKVVKLFKRLGVAAVSRITLAFDSGGFGSWAPNAPITVEMKGHDRVLIDTSQLRRSISYEVKEGK